MSEADPLPEDDFRFARRRLREGASEATVRTELAARNVDADLQDIILRGVHQERTRRKPQLLYIVTGALILAMGLALFNSEVRALFLHDESSFRLPTLVCLIGAGILARGLFR